MLLRGSNHLVFSFVPGEVSAPSSATGHTRKRLAGILSRHCMRKTLTLIILIIGINLFGQKIDKNDYVAITKAILSHEEIRNNLTQYSRFNSHPIYDENRVFILDTVYIDNELIVNENNPKFCITDLFNIKIGYINYWLLPTEIIFNGEKLKYSFKTQSLKWQDSTKYIQGVIKLQKDDGNWTIQKTDIEAYDFKEPKVIECYDSKIECTTDFNRPKKSKTNNSFFGDWQYLLDSIYYETFISDDTLYLYDELYRHAPYDLKYRITDTEFFIYRDDTTILKRSYQIIDKNKIRIYGDYEVIWQNDTSFFSNEYIMERIKKNEYKYSDVKCWGKWSTKYHCFIDSYDGLKYQEKFWERMLKYKDEKWNSK